MADDDSGVEVIHLEPRPFRPFRSSEEYLYAMKEDLAEWMNSLYDLDIGVDNFMERLETGVVLCRHANNVLQTARKWCKSGHNGVTNPLPDRDVVYRASVQPGTFLARDNVSNFISWCRTLAIKECLLFETDDLVLRKNERSFILCLLEVARWGTKVGMPAPLLVQMEQEIEAELARDGSDSDGHEADDDSDTQSEPRAQIITNDLRSLHERVVDLLNRCSCPSQFPMIRVADGKYRIGNTQVLIFVRILRNHVMVRVGGGWDTLEHYLDKHDPCRCRAGHRFSSSAKLTLLPNKRGSLQMQVTYNRSVTNRSSSAPVPSPSRRRSLDLDHFSQYNRDDLRGPSRSSQYSDDSVGDGVQIIPTHRGKTGHPSSAESSSEMSEGEGRNGGRQDRQRKYSPRKIMRIGEYSGESDSAMLSLESTDDGSGTTVEELTFKENNATNIAKTKRESTTRDVLCTPTRLKSQIVNGNSLLHSKKKSRSSENLAGSKMPTSKSEASLVSHIPRCTVPNSLSGRSPSSGGHNSNSNNSNGGIRIGLRRSRTCENNNRRLSLFREEEENQKPLSNFQEKSRSHTWTCRQKSPNSPVRPDTFKSPTKEQSPSKSLRNTNRHSLDCGVYEQAKNYQVLCDITSLKVKLRKESHSNSPSKIPIPKWQIKDPLIAN